MRLLQAFVIAGLLGLGVIAPAVAQDSGFVDLDALRDGGTGRVLVTLRAPDEGSAITPETIRRTVLDRHFQGAMAEIGEPGEIAITHLYDDPLRFAADVDFRALNALRNDPNVDAVEPDRWMRPAMLEIGEAVRAPILHAEGIDGSGVVIVQFDTGVDTDHPFIAANLEDGLCFSTPREGGTSLCPGGAASAEGPGAAEACTDLPECAHGTQTAGIMVGSGGEMRGVAPGARLLPIQVFTRMEGSTYCGEREACLVAWSSDLEMAISEASSRYWQQPEQIGAIYFGFADLPFDPDFETPNVNARCSGSSMNKRFSGDWPIVIPTGNEGRFQRWGGITCSYDFLRFYVQALDASGEIAAFSNTWIVMQPNTIWSVPYLNNATMIPAMAAPGVGVPTSTSGGGFTEVTGTSASAAQIAGVLALLRSEADFPSVELWDALYDSGLWILDRRLNYDVAAVRVDTALEFLNRFSFGPIRIDLPIRNRPEIGFALGRELNMAGPVGGPFEIFLGSFDSGSMSIFLNNAAEGFVGRPIRVSSDADWLDAWTQTSTLGPSSTPIRMSANSVANTFPAGVYSANVTVEVDGLRPVRIPIRLRVGVLNDSIDTALRVEGSRAYSVAYSEDAAADPDAGSLGLVSGRPALWWTWTAPESGHYLVQVRDEIVRQYGAYRVYAFEGATRGGLTPVPLLERCIVRRALPGSTTGYYYRFEAEAGRTYTFAGQSLSGDLRNILAFRLFPANVSGYETSDSPLEVSGSDLFLPVTMHGLDAPCATTQAGLTVGEGSAWLLWTPTETGRHAIEFRHGNTIDDTSYFNRFGRVRVFDETGETLLTTFHGAADILQNWVFEGFFEAETGSRYLIHLEAPGSLGTILEIHPPDDIARPGNDDFEDSIAIGPNLSSFRSNNRYATRETGAGDASGNGRSQWWHFTPAEDGNAYVTMEGTSNRNLSFDVLAGTSLESLEPVISGQPISYLNGPTINHPQAYFDVESGRTYYVRVDGLDAYTSVSDYNRPYGDFQFTVSHGPYPANDDFEDAIPIEFGEIVEGQNRFASDEPGEPTEDFFHDFMEEREELGVWYRWTAPETGRYRMNATSAFINPQIAVYTGNRVDALSLVRGVAHNAGPPPALTPFVFDFDAVAGTIYSIRVSSYMRQQGDFSIWLTNGGPLNDNSNAATPIYPMYPVGNEAGRFVDIVDNTYASAESFEGDHAGFSPETSIWYGSNLRESEQAPFSINTSGSTVDTQITIYTPWYNNYESVPLISNDNVSEGLTSAEIIVPHRGSTPPRNSPGFTIVITSPPDQRGMVRVNAGWDNTLYPRLRGATLPYARSGVVGQPITGFATLLNNGYRAGLDCGLALADPSQPFDLEFRPTNPATNAIDGAAGETRPADVLRPVTYLFALTPREPVAAREVALTYACSNAENAPSVAGVNTVLISADTTQQPDILSIGTTASNDGVIRIPSTSGVGFLSTAALNLGSTGEITFSADVTGTDIPVTIEVCETDLSNGGACRTPRAAQTTVSFGAGEVKTFAVFVRANGAVAFDPAGVRVFARWRDEGGVVRGATSAAVRTP